MAVKVKVEQKEGPLRLTLLDGTEREYTVTDHLISAKNKEEAELLVSHGGASYITKKDEPTTTT